MNKKLLIVIPLIICVTISLFVALQFTARAQITIPGEAYIDPEDTYVNVCEYFVININVADIFDIGVHDYEIWLYYDPAQMTPVNAWDGSFLMPNVSFSWDPSVPGTVWLYAYTDDGPAFGSGTLASVEFHCDEPGDSPLELEVFLSDEAGYMYKPMNITGGVVHQMEIPPAHTYIDPPEYVVPICVPFTVNVMVKDVTDLIGYDLYMSYDTASVDCLDIADAGFIPPPIMEIVEDIDDAAGTIHYAVVSLAPAGTTGSGAIATIKFHCTGPGESILNIDSIVLANSMGQPIPTTVASGRVIQLPYWEPFKLMDIVEWPYLYALVDLPFIPPQSPEGYMEVKQEIEAKGYIFDPVDGTAVEVHFINEAILESETQTGQVTSWWSANTLEDGTRACMLSAEMDDGTSMAMGFVTNVMPPEQIPEVDPYIIYNAEPYFFIDYYWWAWHPIGRVIRWPYWWHDSHNHPNWFWGPYWWWRCYTKAYVLGMPYPWAEAWAYWRPWWGWWWHWVYWRHWYWWSTYFPYDP